MKRSSIKKSLMLGIFILVSSLFLWNCEQEEKSNLEDIHQRTINIERHLVHLSTIEKTNTMAYEILTGLSKEKPTEFSRAEEVYSEEHDLYYDLDHIYMIEQEHYQQYSFLVKSSSQLENQFENYVLVQYADESFRQFVITYEYDSPERASYDYVGIRELEGNQLFTRSISNCPNLPQLEPVTVEVCTYNMCSGNIHEYGDPTCPCGTTSNCDPPSKNCTSENGWALVCPDGGTGDNSGNPNDPNNPPTGGGTGNENDSDNDIPVIPVEETAMDRIIECMNTPSFNGSNITMPESLIDSLLNTGCEALIDDFILEEGCSLATKSFSIEAARACLNRDEVDFEEKIILDSTFVNNQKVKCIYDKLKSSSTRFRDAIKKFDGDFPVSHLKFETKDLGANRRGETRAPDGAGNSPDYIITIAVNSNHSFSAIDYRPNLMTAKTIAHEVIHAEMYRKLISILNNGGNLAGVTIQDVVNALSNGDYPGIYDYYRRYRNWQHQQMATHYRENLARILQEFDTGLAVPNNQLPAQLYLDLAWEGLRKSTIQAWVDLDQVEKNRIDLVIQNYIDLNNSQLCN